MVQFKQYCHQWLIPLVVVGTAAGLSCLSVAPQRSVADDKPRDLQTFMRTKLDASSKILEGLTVEDADMIKKGAKHLLEMSKVEMWNVLTDADYREFNREFRSAVHKLEQAAVDGNFDNAVLQWMDMTKSCIECHKYVRKERVKLKKN